MRGARARRVRARRVGRAGARPWPQRARRRCLRRARERCPCRSAGKGTGMQRTACLRVCGARARVRACACARMCVFVRVSHVQELRPRCWLSTPALATHRPSMNLTYSFGWRPGIARGSLSARAAGTGVTTWHPEHPHSGLGRCLCPFSTARGSEVCALVAHLAAERCVYCRTLRRRPQRGLPPLEGYRVVACYALTTGRANEARVSTSSAPNNNAIVAVLPSSPQSTRTITSATGRKHGGYAAAHARAADRLVVLNRPSGNVHGSARSAQKDRGCIVCHGTKSVRPHNGAIPFSARTVGRVEGAPRDMARQPCVHGAVQLSTRATRVTRLLLCGTR